MNPKSLFKRSKKLLAFEIGEEYLKAVCFREQQNALPEIVDAFLLKAEELSKEELVKAVKKFAANNNVKDALVYNVIPSRYAIFKNIEIPSTDDKEIQQIIDLQAGAHTPYPKDQVILDYLKISIYKKRYTKELLVITKRDIVSERYDILKEAGFEVTDAFLGSEGVAHLLTRNRTKSQKPLAIVHVDAFSTDFIVAEKERPIYVRSIAIGSVDMLNDRAENCPAFIEELEKSLESYQANGISDKPDETVFTGIVEPVAGLLDEAASVLGTKIDVAPYPDVIKPDKKLKKIIGDTPELSLISVASLFITGKEKQISLVPEDVKGRQHLEEKSREVTMAGFLSVIAFILLCAIFFTLIFFRHMYLSQLKESYKDENTEVKRLDHISSKANRLEAFLHQKGNALAVLVDLYQAIPETVYLESIEYDAEEVITITGTAGSMSQVFSMVTDIENSRDFKNVHVDFTRSRRVDGEEVADFGLTMEVE